MLHHSARPWPGRAVMFAAMAIALAAVPEASSAYVGPGAGLTAIGTVLAFVAALALAVVGFVWYPVKRLLKRSPARADGSKAERGPE